jgi:hypothetical protein
MRQWQSSIYLAQLHKGQFHMNRKISFLLIAVVALMLAACGGGAAPGGGTTSTTLSETYNSDGITFKYPSGWVVEPAASAGGPIIIANNQASLDASQSGSATTVSAGQQYIILLPFTGESFQALSSVVTSPVDLLNQIGTGMTSTSGVTLGTPTELTIGGKAAAKASGSGDIGDTTLIAINIGDAGYVMVVGGAAKGEMGNLDGTLNAVAETVAVTPAS